LAEEQGEREEGGIGLGGRRSREGRGKKMFDTLLNSKFYNKWYWKIDLFVVRFLDFWVSLSRF